ncbi:transcription initiation factor TFIID subunit 1-like protein isoform X1 [Tanacetum coccineum]
MRVNEASCQACGGRPSMDSQANLSRSWSLGFQGLRLLKQEVSDLFARGVLMWVLVSSSNKTLKPPRYLMVMLKTPLSSQMLRKLFNVSKVVQSGLLTVEYGGGGTWLRLLAEYGCFGGGLLWLKIGGMNKDLAYFHRPKALWHPHENVAALEEQGALLTRGSMKVVLMSFGWERQQASYFKPWEHVKIIYSGKELPGENKSLRPPGAFEKKSDLSARDGHVFSYGERPLRLGNPGMGAPLCTYYQKVSPGDQTGAHLHSEPNNLGNVLTLDPADKSPILGR